MLMLCCCAGRTAAVARATKVAAANEETNSAEDESTAADVTESIQHHKDFEMYDYRQLTYCDAQTHVISLCVM